MRQAVRALTIGSVLLAVAACGTSANTAPSVPAVGSAAPPSIAASQAGDAATKSLCEALGRVYSRNMAPFAEALTTHDPEQVRKALNTFATALLAATQENTDPQLRTDGKQAAEQLQAKAKDAATFRAVKTTDDVNTMVGPTLREWLTPVARHCS